MTSAKNREICDCELILDDYDHKIEVIKGKIQKTPKSKQLYDATTKTKTSTVLLFVFGIFIIICLYIYLSPYYEANKEKIKPSILSTK